MSDINELLVEALHETKKLKNGEIFFVRDLFKGYHWNRIPHKDCLLLDLLFLNHVNEIKGDLQAIEKIPPNQYQYKKIII